MAKEAYCSFEISKLLKDKGFDEPCLSYFWTEDNGANIDYCDRPFTNKQLYSGQILRPTHQMAMAWLREVYNIYISIQPDFPSDKDYKMCWCWSANILHENCISLKGYQCYIETYEEAVEAALKYSLENLI